MAHSNERSPMVSRINVASRASSAALVIPGIFFRKKARLKNVYYADGATIAKSNSNYLTVKLQDNASTPVVYAKAATSDAAVVAATQYPLPFVPADADNSAQAISEEIEVPANTMLNVNLAGIGTAVSTDACVIIEWYPL